MSLASRRFVCECLFIPNWNGGQCELQHSSGVEKNLKYLLCDCPTSEDERLALGTALEHLDDRNYTQDPGTMALRVCDLQSHKSAADLLEIHQPIWSLCDEVNDEPFLARVYERTLNTSPSHLSDPFPILLVQGSQPGPPDQPPCLSLLCLTCGSFHERPVVLMLVLDELRWCYSTEPFWFRWLMYNFTLIMIFSHPCTWNWCREQLKENCHSRHLFIYKQFIVAERRAAYFSAYHIYSNKYINNVYVSL